MYAFHGMRGCRDSNSAALGAYACGEWTWGVHRPTSRFRHTYERYSNRMKKIWQYCQFSYRLIIPPNRSTGKCRRGKITSDFRLKGRSWERPLELAFPAWYAVPRCFPVGERRALLWT